MGVHRWPPQPAPARRWPVLTAGPKGRKRQIVSAGLIVLLVMLLAACGRSAPAQPAPAANESRGAKGEPKGGTAASFPVQTSEGGQVSVAVTWSGPESGLIFDVAMNTHSVELDGYDLQQLAVLRTDQGQEVKPSAWDAPEGGHHRAGTLTFPDQGPDGRPVLNPEVRTITLVIRDIAGVAERSFQWTW